MTDPIDTSACRPECDPVLALGLAVQAVGPERFEMVASACGDATAAQRITQVADVFVAWLRRPTHVTLGTPTIEEIPEGTP